MSEVLPEAFFVPEGGDYASVLGKLALSFEQSEYYYQVGAMEKTQGWILHLSVIRAQLPALLRLVLPLLVAEGVPFKIVLNTTTFDAMVDGGLGYQNLGKIVCIYTPTDAEAVRMAQALITLTGGFRGPAIPTDMRLGGCVYTRYGSFTPVVTQDKNGRPVKNIYNAKGELIPDPYYIPFRLPQEIPWPFGEIASPALPVKPKLLHNKYYPIKKLKADAKGDVLKALFFKGPLHIASCLVKQGRKDMFADLSERDVQDRLIWQETLHRQLKGLVPLPEIYELFYELDSCYIAMEFVNGIALAHWIEDRQKEIFWPDIRKKDRMRLLTKLIDILDIIQVFHEQGFVHRDINPQNFLIDKRERLHLIDSL